MTTSTTADMNSALRRHVVVTPAHNEEQLLPRLCESMVRQTAQPSQWIVVDDHSTDCTAEIVEGYSERYPWISRVAGALPEKRELGSKVARLFLQGLATARGDWSFCSKIDADLTLPLDYFEQILNRFAANSRLGIAGGGCYEERNEEMWYEPVPIDHVRGALKTYRRQCYEAIGGVRPIHGWDGVDALTAQITGWETRSFPEVKVLHHRSSGSARGLLEGRFKAGEFAHFMGYHPIFMALRCGRRLLVDRPPLLAGAAMGAGFFWATIRGKPVFSERDVVRYLRGKQLRRLGLSFLFPEDGDP
ncbi:MAG: glycosyltransferase family A protein [Myxococcota bacterium]